MIKFFLKLCFAMLCPILLKANLCSPVSHALEELIEQAEFVIEGEIIGQHSFWDANDANILTAHQIKVKQCTGSITQPIVSLLTKGGCVEDDCIMFSNQNTFQLGDYGIFFALQSNENINSKTDELHLSLISSQLNFINLNSQLDVFNIQYKTYSEQAIFEKVENQTGKTFAYKQKEKNVSAQKKAASISFISPLKMPADGTHTLTIRGSGFGSLTSSAKIYMLNPNYASGSSYIAIPNSFITKWNNQLIQIKVPGFDIRSNFPGVASGSVKIITSSGAEVTSAQKVNVTYNHKKLDNKPIDLISHSNNGEIPFYVSNALRKDGALPAIERAFNLWYCQTGVKFKIAGYVNTTCYERDNKNVISYDDGCSISQLGFTRISVSTCSSKNDAYLKDLDIIINRDKKWSFDLEKDNAGTSDFASTILHEMGHAHLLGHVLNEEDILYPVILKGGVKKELNDDNQNGGGAIVLESKKQNGCTSYKPASVFKEGACCAPVKDDKVIYTSENFAVLTFTKADADNQVSIRYNKLGQSKWEYITTSRSYARLNDLEACAFYQVQVSDACGNADNNQYNKPRQTFQTKGCNSCSAPENAIEPVVNKNSVTVGWNTIPNKDVYEIQYRVGYGNSWTLYKLGNSKFTKQNTDRCSVFQYRLRTYCGDEVSEYTRIKTIQTFCEDGGGKLNSNEINEVEFVLAPNPVKDQLLIIPQQIDLSNAICSIKDINGRTIQAEALLPDNYFINTSKLATGIYFIEVIKNEVHFTQRFVKE